MLCFQPYIPSHSFTHSFTRNSLTYSRPRCAHRCGHCKSLAPEYEKAATELLKNDPPVTLAKVDATVESDLGSRFGVTGYPTLKIFRKGVESGPYEGPRKADGIVKYMQKQAGPSSKELTEVSVAKKFVE